MWFRHDAKRLPSRRAIGTIAAIGALLIFTAGPVSADHGPAGAGGPYSGFSTSAVLHVDAVTTETTRVVDLEVGVANALANSEGLETVKNQYQRVLAPDVPGTAHSVAHATVVEAGVAHAPDAENQVKPFFVTAMSPGDPAEADAPLLKTNVATAAFVDILNRNAQTRWNSDTCVIGAPISLAQQHAARVEVLETGDDPDTAAGTGFDKPVAGLDAEADGPHRAAAHVVSFEQLFKGSGAGLGLFSATATTLAPVTLFQGTANEFRIEVDGPGQLVAMADGVSGGAKVHYNAPIVTVFNGGTSTKVLPNAPLIIKVPDSETPLVQIKVGTLEGLTNPNSTTGDTAANGTSAGGIANIVEVTLLKGVGGLMPGATIALGHMEAKAVVPAGGIECPIPVTKVASPSSVAVGNNFTTTITVENPFSCELTNVSLGDVISVEKAARFKAVSAVPSTSLPGGSELSSGSARWSLGTIAPGAKKSVKVTLGAQGGVGRILDTATASGQLANCPAKPASGEAGTDVTGLANTTVPVEGIATLRVPTASVLGTHETRLPKTGLNDRGGMLAGMALLLGALGLSIVMRRRARA